MEEGTLLTEKQAAILLNYTPSFLQKRRMTGDGPPFVRISATSIRYRRKDLELFIENRIRTSTSDQGENTQIGCTGESAR